MIIEVYRLYSNTWHTQNEFTFPGKTVPTEGIIVTGESSGTRNSKEVGPTGAISPLPILGTAWVKRLRLTCAFITYSVAVDTSFKAVAANLTKEWDNSRGGWTPTALHDSLNCLKINHKLSQHKQSILNNPEAWGPDSELLFKQDSYQLQWKFCLRMAQWGKYGICFKMSTSLEKLYLNYLSELLNRNAMRCNLKVCALRLHYYSSITWHRWWASSEETYTGPM